MNTADTHTAEILEYNNWLIIKLINSPKLKIVGVGTLLSNINSKDLKISISALNILKANLNVNLNKENPALEILSETSIWWASINNGIIIPPNELLHVYTIPTHSICENKIDDDIKMFINKQ